MKIELSSHDRDRDATGPAGAVATRDQSQLTGRSLALFVVAELLCIGALIAWLAL
jgi:hypothetical protein